MRKNILVVPVIAVMVLMPSFATSDSIVTSKNYVDTTFQEKIPVSGTNAGVPGETVVTYTDTAGAVGERGIYSGSSTYNSTNDENKLVTAGTVKNVVDKVANLKVYVDKLECANEECTLYNVVPTEVGFRQMAVMGGAPYFAPWQGRICVARGGSCASSTDCCSSQCALTFSMEEGTTTGRCV